MFGYIILLLISLLGFYLFFKLLRSMFRDVLNSDD